ncbi:M56 family metallopeptidase [Erythrobacter sp. BLCC-B19]|uniref:M56 family metallopeptidase n=1 Tax=Erythrobacter sp. BLCC-B19 TaxID=3025315 RepID=UPI002361FECC|nr:M56 family metallopeptidase [Erythrobacter sp. BLCC-B19]WDA40487.1 M56 family metallopeptidase [Erythrobacter sp. BLCC-B19]
MSAVLIETLAWTGVLIAAVLVLRRPVSRHFGPEAAYALWALPLLRLIVPPVTLPAWMAPNPEAAPAALANAGPMADASATASDPALWQVAATAPDTALPAPLPISAEAATAPSAGFDLIAALSDIPVIEGLLAIWLVGTAVFLALRFSAYFTLRDLLLAEGRELGRARGFLGLPVRLIETPATDAPLAMGVLDPVIALPPGFLALHDRAARDLALAHELAHHRGGDLLVNICVQPLFALHWFNPLARYGWLALRRDQEAACDARVMAHRSAHERAAYGALIARFAAAPGSAHHAALTAPMACPVLGEKSIIHRLRSLAMSDLSPRRRLAGRALLGAGLLALPLTASISYAASEAEPAPVEAPEAPEPPAPPSAPEAPEPPAAPEAPEPPTVVIIKEDGTTTTSTNTEVTEQVWRDADGKEHRIRMVFRATPDGEAIARKFEGIESADKAERAEMFAALQEGLAEAERVRADLPRIMAEAFAAADAASAQSQRVIVKRECKPGSDEVSETTTKDGVQIVSICQARIYASARKGLEEARAEIARDKDIPEDTRKMILRTLDNQIARWSEKEG